MQLFKNKTAAFLTAIVLGISSAYAFNYTDEQLLSYMSVLERTATKGQVQHRILRSQDATQDQRQQARQKLGMITGQIALDEGFTAHSFTELTASIRSSERLRVRAAELYSSAR